MLCCVMHSKGTHKVLATNVSPQVMLLAKMSLGGQSLLMAVSGKTGAHVVVVVIVASCISAYHLISKVSSDR